MLRVLLLVVQVVGLVLVRQVDILIVKLILWHELILVKGVVIFFLSTVPLINLLRIRKLKCVFCVLPLGRLVGVSNKGHLGTGLLL